MNKTHIYFVGISLLLIISCSGLDDLVFDRHPQLSEMQVFPGDRVSPFDTVYASIEATNPIDGILEYQWTIDPERGTFVGPSDSDSIRWVAPIQGGFYDLKVSVKNTAKKSTATKQIEVLVTEKPIVDIREPSVGAYYVVGQSFAIEVRAEHANGLSWVRALVNDSLITTLDQNGTGIYQFSCVANNAMVGTATVKIEAKSNNVAEPGTDLVDIEIGGIITGKHGTKPSN